MKRNFFQDADEIKLRRFADALREGAPVYEQNFDFTLSEEAIERLTNYYALVLKWNARLHLVAPCSPEEFAARHVLESLCALRFLDENARVMDIGSGGGLPAIPCLLARPRLSLTMIEANAKKSIFLREALNQLSDDAPKHRIINARFEQIAAPEADYLTCRALENFTDALPRLIEWSRAPELLLFGGENLRAAIENLGLNSSAALLPNSKQRFLFQIRRD
jgi:16S rRNA (guanine527-N7)-methyltransferase